MKAFCKKPFAYFPVFVAILDRADVRQFEPRGREQRPSKPTASPPPSRRPSASRSTACW
jgi:hypothetical protein